MNFLKFVISFLIIIIETISLNECRPQFAMNGFGPNNFGQSMAQNIPMGPFKVGVAQSFGSSVGLRGSGMGAGVGLSVKGPGIDFNKGIGVGAGVGTGSGSGFGGGSNGQAFAGSQGFGN